MKRCLYMLAAVIIIITGLTGCTPQLPERLLIRAIGVDAVDTGWRVTVRAYDFDQETQTEKSFSGAGDTVASALEKITRQSGKIPLYSHSSVIIFGRSCAENGLDRCIDFFIRHYDACPAMNVLISDSTAEDILRISDTQEAVPTENILSLQNAEKYSSSVTSANLVTLINGTLGPNETAVVPIIRMESAPEIIGAGLLSNFKLIDTADTETMQGMLLIKGEPVFGETVFNTENCGTVSVTTAGNTGSIRFTGTKAEPAFDISVRIEGRISSIDHSMRPLSGETFSEIERAYAEKTLESIILYLESQVLTKGMDTAGFGTSLLRHEPDIRHSVSGGLSDFLQSAVYTINVKADIDRIEEEDTPYF